MSLKKSQDTRRALKRAFELREAGKTWQEVVQALQNENFRDSRENPYSVGNLKAAYSRRRDEIMNMSVPNAGPAPHVADVLGNEHNEHCESESQPHKRPADCEQKEPKAWEHRVREIVREELQTMMGKEYVQPMIPSMEEAPPESTTIKGHGKGRKEPRVYERVTLTLDKELARLFKQEQKRHGISAGKLFDRILWQRYGKPRLSYEAEEE